MATHFDYICIGGGSGGIASANRAAMYGAKVALIEAQDLGGTCVNVGCVPKKVMWHGAQVAEAMNLYAEDYGFDVDVKGFDWSKLVESRQAYIGRIHQSYDRVLGNNKVNLSPIELLPPSHRTISNIVHLLIICSSQLLS